MILADIQTTINVMVAVLAVSAYFAVYLGFRVLRAVGRTLGDSYQKGGGNRQLLKNVGTKGLGMLLKRLFLKLVLKR